MYIHVSEPSTTVFCTRFYGKQTSTHSYMYIVLITYKQISLNITLFHNAVGVLCSNVLFEPDELLLFFMTEVTVTLCDVFFRT